MHRVGETHGLTRYLLSNTTAYPRSYVGPFGPATVYPFQADLARIDTAIVFVTKYAREGYDLHDLKVSLLQLSVGAVRD